jgi:hypothetical protein
MKRSIEFELQISETLTAAVTATGNIENGMVHNLVVSYKVFDRTGLEMEFKDVFLTKTITHEAKERLGEL